MSGSERATSVRVLLVEDHELMRRGVREFLNDHGGFEVVAETGSKEETIDLVEEIDIDVALLDLRLPDGTGVEVCRAIKDRDPEVACLILTSFDDDSAYLDAAYAGADAYLLKERTGAELIADIRRVLEGDSLLDARRVAQLVEEASTSRRALEELSENEYRILRLIGAGLSNREIAERLYLAEQTVKNYVSRLLSKLEIHTRMEAALFAQQLPDKETET